MKRGAALLTDARHSNRKALLPDDGMVLIMAPEMCCEEAGLATGFFLPAIQALWVYGASVVAFWLHTKRPRRPDYELE